MADELEEKWAELRSTRIILESVIKQLGEISWQLTHDEALPVLFQKLEQLSLELQEAQKAYNQEQKKLWLEAAKWVELPEKTRE